jgi:FtsP/CotA-like multicopper oxidase with cupredoxin domain
VRAASFAFVAGFISLARIEEIPTAAVLPNDNLQSAGRLEGTVLTARLYAATGAWRPKGPTGPAIEIAAFGEEGRGLSTPGPLIRARVGTTVSVSLRNDLDSPLRVYGLCAKPGPCEPVVIAPGGSHDIRFALNVPGTYHYWAARSGTLANRSSKDSQLSGAIIVDPANGATTDRILVIGLYSDAEGPGRCFGRPGPNPAFTINGSSWPFTTRLHYTTGEAVRWRVLNLSCEGHAMHLHGFHFMVDAAGDGLADTALAGEQRRTVVTEQMEIGGTISMTWTPTRPGNWLFHCHMLAHMIPQRGDEHALHVSGANHAGMAGLVIGTEVTGPARIAATPAAPRRLTMSVNEEADGYGKGQRGFRVELEGFSAPRLSAGAIPGPVLVLHRGEPAEITVVNRTTQHTAMHWHGIEIESYFDGVPGFGGDSQRVAPSIAPGASFVVKFTPPRAGTFMYHTHWHDVEQLARGIYGAIIVLEPGQQYDPAVDHIVVIGVNGAPGTRAERPPLVLNGRTMPDSIILRAGVPNRLRLINITANNVALTFSLVSQFDLAQWRLIAKDGADVAGEPRALRPARQLVSVGETIDFEFTPSGQRNLWFNVQGRSGVWFLQAPVRVR